ncbi:MAG TPA: HAMP domain-containing sensor histidine kinase [Edaphobacter sp.]|nr:HAMP domain-containing sensor histidine kinase [Edaphobacter sp.]
MWALHWGCFIGVLGLAGAALLMRHERRLHAKERQRDRRIREEFEAYARLDAGFHGSDVSELAKRVCRLVSRKSAFQRVAMLALDSAGRMSVTGSVGVEETTVQALHAWAEREETGIRVGEKSFAVVLGDDFADAACGRAIMIPLRTSTGQMRGALAVCADSLMSLRRQTVEETILPLEALALKLSRAIEDAEVVEQLKQWDKLAGDGLLATGVAHALSDPLTSVLEFAELIAETAKETRVKADAEMIVHEARRMQQTVQNLGNFDLSAPCIDEPVEIAALVRDLAAECEEKLEARGVLLVVEAEEDGLAVRGNGDSLRQVLEHLLNNAAQAIASINDENEDADDAEREREIRVSVSHGAGSLQVIVSDTGPGFREPERVFEPARLSREAGIGLAICYGIVREHGGEISAFNLHPYGAAVVVELPLGESLAQDFSGVAQEVA